MSTSALRQSQGPQDSYNEKHFDANVIRHKPIHNHRKGLLGTLDRHQIDGTLTFIISVLGTYALFPNSFAKKFLFFQNYDPETNTIEKSWDDLYFMTFWIACFTFLRASVMRFVLTPIAKRFGAANERAVGRFAEQGWICIYYSCSWVLGMYCLQLTPTWNNWLVWFHTDKFFDSYPLTALPIVTKYYYWLQFSFWVQQLFVLCIEAPRKDFLAMVGHHFITISLITFSLGLNVTTFGTAVMAAMDLADIVLSFGKCLKYIETTDKICDPIFALFMVIWIYTRHFLYGVIIYSWMTTGRAYSSAITYFSVNTLLLSLQGLMFFWLYSIFRIVYKMFATNTGVVDDRSDDEEEKVLPSQDNKQRIV